MPQGAGADLDLWKFRYPIDIAVFISNITVLIFAYVEIYKFE